MKIKLPDEFFRMPRFAPAIFAGFLSFLLLLFLRDVGDKIRMFLLLSLILYTQCATFVGMIHRHLGLHYEKTTERNNEKTIPIIWRIILYFVHLVLLVFLAGYNFYKCVL